MNPAKDWPRVASAAVLAAGGVGTVAINWPGHLSFDPILQLLQGRPGVYNTWHPPVMAWLLGLFDAIHPGAGLFVAFDAMLAFGALGLLSTIRRARWSSVAAAAYPCTPLAGRSRVSTRTIPPMLRPWSAPYAPGLNVTSRTSAPFTVERSALP